MFTKKFNNLSDSLIEAATKALAKPIVNEASNETPTINHLELSEEEINELSPAALQKYKAVSRERMRDQGVVGKELQKRQTGYSTATKKLSGDAKVGAKEPEKKPEPSFGVKVGKITPKTPYKSSYSMIKEPPQRGASYMPQKAAASPMKEEETLSKLNAKAQNPNPNTTLTTPMRPRQIETKETELKGNQHKIDVAPPYGKLTKHDFEKLRNEQPQISEGRKPKDGGDPGDEGSYVDPETGEKSAPPKKHIMNQLRQAAQSMKAQHPVTYADGSTHNVPKHVAKALVNAYQDPRKKPYEREAMQAKIGQSHKELMQHHSELNEDSYNPKLSHKGKMLDEVPVETMKQVKMVNQEEAEEEPPFEPTKKVNWRASKQSRAKWLAKTAMEKMKKKSMKEEEAVKPGAQYAKKVSIPEEEQIDEISSALVNRARIEAQRRADLAQDSGHMGAAYQLQQQADRLERAQSRKADDEAMSPAKARRARREREALAQQMSRRNRTKPKSTKKVRSEEVNEEQIVEREMTSDEKSKREKIVMALKKKMAGFKERYGSRAKDVMYATATKQAMKQEETSDGPKDGVKINPPMSTKEGIGIKSTTT
jgi:hypothetical protein